MRQTYLLIAVFVLCFSACTPSRNPEYRAREARPYPTAADGTDNHESQTYKTQIIAAPPAQTAPETTTKAPKTTAKPAAKGRAASRVSADPTTASASK